MDLLKDDLWPLYRRFLIAALGSAMLSGIFTFVDMAMVGQYYGPVGAAAMVVIAPIWNLIYSLGLLVGIGGSVLYAVARGEGNEQDAHQFFTSSVMLGILTSALVWGLLVWLEVPVLRFFGADDQLLPLCREYLIAPLWTIPLYGFTGILAAFLRNDSDPGLAARAVLTGGVFNIFGDYFFIFTLNMGIRGAGIATAMGAAISVLIMLWHFLKTTNTLRLVWNTAFWKPFASISGHGFSSFVIDIAMGVLTVLFNRQIMQYLGADALAVYGVIATVSTFVQCSAYGVGQAAQPILSQNYGAGLMNRIGTTLRYNLVSVFVIGILWTVVIMLWPNAMIRVFMAPTPEVLQIAPSIVWVYALSFLLLPFNIYTTYYFQATMQTGLSLFVSIARGMVISGVLICLLPKLFGGDSVWWAMPITEVLIAVYAAIRIMQNCRRCHESHGQNTGEL